MTKSYLKWAFLLTVVGVVCYASAVRADTLATNSPEILQGTTMDELKVLLRVAVQQAALTAVTNPSPAVEPILVHNTSEAVGAAIHFQMPNTDMSDCVKLGGGLCGLLIFGAHMLRKAIPDKWQVNWFGLLLAHLTTVNPSLAKLATAAAEVEAAKVAKPATPTA